MSHIRNIRKLAESLDGWILNGRGKVNEILKTCGLIENECTQVNLEKLETNVDPIQIKQLLESIRGFAANISQIFQNKRDSLQKRFEAAIQPTRDLDGATTSLLTHAK